MQPNRAQNLSLFVLLAVGILGCVAESTALNSERIARKFGSYGVEVIENNENIRVSNLYSIGPAGRVCRTFAVVRLTDDIDVAYAAEHARILEGGSIGAVFKRNGWTIEKRHQYIGEMAIGKQAIRLARLMRIEPPMTLAVHIYVLAISKNGRSFDYAMIAEVHHPDYLTTGGLWSVYGSEYSGDKNRNGARQVLTLVRSKFRDAS